MAQTTLVDRLLTVFGPNESGVDEGLWEVAAMVYVGDVYAVMVADAAQSAVSAAKAKQDADESLWPFIR